MFSGAFFTSVIVLAIAILATFDRTNIQNGIFVQKVPNDFNVTPRELTGKMAHNKDLVQSQKLFENQIYAPECVFVKDEQLYGSSQHNGGAIYKLHPSNDTVDVIAKTNGRPLGVVPYKDSFLVADAQLGLLQVVPGAQQEVTVLANTYSDNGETKPITYANDLKVDEQEGKVYFTSSCLGSPDSQVGTLQVALSCLVSLCKGGVVLQHDLAKNETTLLKSGLYYANGVAIVEGEQHDKALLVVDTYGAVVWRLYLAGPKIGQWDKFMDTHGFADNIIFDQETQSVWIAYFTRTDQYALVQLLFKYDIVRHALLYFPVLRPKSKLMGMIAQIDLDGNVMRSMHDPLGEVVGPISQVVVHQGFLYMGSVVRNFVARIKI